ncbi:uncharacterized protein I303_105844 [Kwoniella dejecticola CBS 10117]|uniref:Uncharacterized protein n=1 Tax=Kwoniella dejecticola CBS 10117 TaxID=1296121 RepID=A0A1A6A0K0_9TREE|nr:uncharacterized protein I303_05865 [Kwoniella dejecticola CBS 10117]OBR83585.1 hypothetical protein I303_05865 [Kwoniella dejecticola CBS 10117]
MPPRLPTRQCVETVQLGFLLPWAGRRSAHSSPSTTTVPETGRPPSSLEQVQEQGQHAESSRMASLRQNCSSRPSNPTRMPNTSSSSQSIIHRYLSSPNPPPPSSLLIQLKANRRHLTLSAGQALSSYCIRMGDFKTYRAVWRLLADRRVAPMSMVIHHMSKKYPHKPRPPSATDFPDPPLTVTSTREDRVKTFKFRPNRWAIKMFPPSPTLHSRQYTKQALLRHLHYLILQGEPPTFQESINLFISSIDYSTANPNNEHEGLDLLNLHLAYIHKPPQSNIEKIDGLDLINQYQRGFDYDGAKAKLNKQTMHLLVKLLIAESHPLGNVREGKGVQTKILACISYFIKELKIIPGPETFRILAKHAAYLGSDELAHVAWEGWSESINQLGTPRISRSNTIDESNVIFQNAVGSNGGNSRQDPRIRFRRIGSMNKRWTEIVDLYKEVGWVSEVEYQQDIQHATEHGDVSVGQRYMWMGEKGRLERLAQIQAERESHVPNEEKEGMLALHEARASVISSSSVRKMQNEERSHQHRHQHQHQYASAFDLTPELRPQDSPLHPSFESHQTVEKVDIDVNDLSPMAMAMKPLPNTVEPPLTTSDLVEVKMQGEQIQHTPKQELLVSLNPANKDVNVNIPDTPNTHDIQQTPYFVIIRDGSTVKIRSKAKAPADEMEFEDHLDGLALDDKPFWE